MTKITPAQKRFLSEHVGTGHFRSDQPDGYRPKWLIDRGSPTYDFVGRVRDLGLIEIDNGDSRTGWPYNWAGTRITNAGRSAL